MAAGEGIFKDINGKRGLPSAILSYLHVLVELRLINSQFK